MPRFFKWLPWVLGLAVLTGCRTQTMQPMPAQPMSKAQRAAALLGVPPHLVRADAGAAAPQRTATLKSGASASKASAFGAGGSTQARAKALTAPKAKRSARKQAVQASQLSGPAPDDSDTPATSSRTTWTREALANTYQTYNPHGMGFELSLYADGSMSFLVPDDDRFTRYVGRWVVKGDRITLSYQTNNTPRRLVYAVREDLKPADESWIPGCRGSWGLLPVSPVRRGSPGDYFVWPRAAVQSGQAPCPE